MDLEIIILSKVSQTEKHKYLMISLKCVIYKTQQTSKYNNNKKNRLTNIENKLVATSGEK